MAYDWRDSLRQEMKRQGLTPKQLSLAAGQGETYVRDILEDRDGKPPNEPRAKALAEIARVLGMTLQKLYEGIDATHQKITIIGNISDDDHWLPRKKTSADAGDLELRIDGGEPVALEVLGKGLVGAGYRHGDLLIGAKRVGANADNLLGLECIIMTEKGDRYVKHLMRGNVRGTFNLRAHDDPSGLDDIVNVRVAWVAPIEWVRRGGKH